MINFGFSLYLKLSISFSFSKCKNIIIHWNSEWIIFGIVHVYNKIINYHLFQGMVQEYFVWFYLVFHLLQMLHVPSLVLLNRDLIVSNLHKLIRCNTLYPLR